jgi:hypothetical protein
VSSLPSLLFSLHTSLAWCRIVSVDAKVGAEVLRPARPSHALTPANTANQFHSTTQPDLAERTISVFFSFCPNRRFRAVLCKASTTPRADYGTATGCVLALITFVLRRKEWKRQPASSPVKTVVNFCRQTFLFFLFFPELEGLHYFSSCCA